MQFHARRFAIVAALLGSLAGTALAEPGALTQLAGTDGCISNDGTGGECTPGKGLAGALDVAVSADGGGVYVASYSNAAVAILSRNRSKAAGPIGQLTQAASPDGCVSETGDGGQCVDGKGLAESFAVAVSEDGRNVYVAGSGSDAVSAFARNPVTNGLSQLAGTDGCVSETGSAGECSDGIGLDRPLGLGVARDGKHVYATAETTASVTALSRNKGKLAPVGALTAIGCLSEIGGDCADQDNLSAPVGVKVSPDGRHVYVASVGASAILAFRRDRRTGTLTPLAGTDACVSDSGSGGTCVQGRALLGARAVAVSRDGRNVYVASEYDNGVAVFARDRKTGVLTQLAGTAGCVSENGAIDACTDGKALIGPRGIAVSRDGRHVYVGSATSEAVAVFARDRKTGALTQLAGTDGCVSETGTGGECNDGKALRGAGAVAVSNDGKSVYVASLSSSAVAVFSRQRN
jgi:DNA-binding beta-propeller fold protein YncE